MKKIEKILGVLGLCGLLALSACDATVENEADGTGSDAVTGTDTTTTGDTAVTPTGYTVVTIDGAPEANPDCTTSSAGADIDVIAVYDSKGALKGVGKTVVHKEGATPKCPKWGSKDVAKQTCTYGTIKPECHNDPNDVTGGLNTKMYADSTPDTGYFGLSGGTVEVTIGACTVSTADVKSCDGKGAAVQIMPGDEIDVYEVDSTYKKGGTTPAGGIAPDNCTCTAEGYEVFVSKKAGESLVSLGKFSGSKGLIKVQ
jgi:hypothetical protein